MKKKVIISIMIVSVLGIILYLLTNRHHIFYSSICGSGMDGLKLLILYYLPILILGLIVFFIIKNRKLKYECHYCRRKLDEKYNICPYCGQKIGGDEIGV